MDMEKPTKTLADYLVIAVSPILIMVLVHSVCFFLADVFYRGEAAGGVRWVLFWFVLAVVLIARIGMVQGDGHALVYGLLLAGATWVYLSKVQSNVIFGAILLGVVWFTAHKITCNCTLVDDEADASGQGLMQSLRRLPGSAALTSLRGAGFLQDWRLKRRARCAPTAGSPPVAETAKSSGSKILETSRGGARRFEGAKKVKSSRSPAPGLWLLYYSLAALPIFGLGQTLLPAGDMAARHRCFVDLFCYLAAALGLLITTSFLGLRRYLRQRYLVMPGNIAFGWIQFGVVGAALVLCLSLLLPRPGAGEAWGVLRYQVNHQLRRASEYAARFNPHGSGSGRSGNQAPPSGQQENQPPQPGPASNPNQHQDQNPDANGQGNQPSGAKSNPGAPEGKAGGDNPGKNVPNLSPAAGSLYPWLKALFYVAAVLGAGWLLYRCRVVVLTMLRAVWAAMRDFIAQVRGLFQSAAAAPPAATRGREVPPFKMFKSPFLTGGDQVWPPEQLIVYSYDALQSWALEQEAPQGLPQTPREFCRQLGAEMPEAATALNHLAFLYGHVAYGGSVPGNLNREQLRLLWELMSSSRPKPAGVEPGDSNLTA
jgi:hypothetical protein